MLLGPSGSVFRAGKALNSVCDEIVLSQPEAIQSRTLRKYIATCCQVCYATVLLIDDDEDNEV